MAEPQALKGTIKRHLNLKVKQRDKQFKIIVDSGITKNYIVPKTVKWLGLLYQQKEQLYMLILISGEPVPYKKRIINLKTGLV